MWVEFFSRKAAAEREEMHTSEFLGGFFRACPRPKSGLGPSLGTTICVADFNHGGGGVNKKVHHALKYVMYFLAKTTALDQAQSSPATYLELTMGRKVKANGCASLQGILVPFKGDIKFLPCSRIDCVTLPYTKGAPCAN